MRPLAAGLRALMASGRFRFAGRCELVDQNGMWRDVTDWLGTNWFDSATWTENADQPVSTGSVVLKREDRGISLAPAMGGSPANHVGAAYSPFLVEGGGVRLSCAITAEGTLPAAGDWQEVFIGSYDAVKLSSTDPTITLDLRDKGAYVVDTFTRTKKTYAPIDEETGTGGAPLETVVQQMLDDNVGAGVVVLAVPVSPGVMVSNVEVERKSLMEAVRDVAMMIGWDIRYRYDGAGVSRLTLTKPARTSAPGNESVWFAANEYVAVPRLDVSIVDTRQAVRVDFLNADTGDPDFVEVEDAAAILKYGPPRGPVRWAQLGFAATSTINTKDEATTLANAAVADLALPFSDHDLDLFPMWWPAQIGDYIGARANARTYDSDQSFGVFGFTHTMDNASSSTTLVTKGRVVGAFKEWLRRSDSDKGTEEGETPDTRVLALKNFREVRRTPTKVTYGWNECDPDVAEIWTWGKLSPQDVDPPVPPGENEDRLWRDTEADAPDAMVDRDTTEFEVTVPDHGNIQTWELLPVGVAHERGYAQRVKVLAVPDIPRVTSIETEEGATGLFTDILKLNVVDPQALGGTLSAWLNHDIAEDALGDGVPDGTCTVALTPYTFTPADVFTVPGGTAQLFDNVRIHGGAGKRVTFEFVNSHGISSGKISFVLLSNGGVITPDGQLKDASINRAEQVLGTMTIPSIYDSLPTTGRLNEIALLTTPAPPKLYRWTGTAWTAAVPAVDVTGQMTAAQIADHIIGLTKIATTLAPPEIFTTPPTGAPGINRVALYNGTLYRSTADGSAWTNTAGAIAAADITGQLQRAQLAVQIVNKDLLENNAVEGPAIKASAVTSLKIGAGEITTNHMNFGTIAGDRITVGTLNGDRVVSGSVDTLQLHVDAVQAGIIGAGAVNTRELHSDAVTTDRLGAGQVVTTHMVAGSINGDRITARTLNAQAIITGTLAAETATLDAVTAGILSANAIATTALATNSITGPKILNGEVGPLKISVTMLSEIKNNAGIIVAGKLQSLDGTRYLDLNATGSNPFLQHPALTLRSDGSATFSGALSAASGTFGTVTAGLMRSADTLRWLWLDASSTQEFIKHPALTLWGDGTATFSGAISSSSFSTVNAAFSGEASFRSTLSIYSGGYGAEPQGGIRFYGYDTNQKARIALYNPDGLTYDSLTIYGYNSMVLSTATGAITLQPAQLVLLNARTVIQAFEASAAVNVADFKWQINGGANITVGRWDYPTAATGDTGLWVVHHTDSGTYVLKRVTCAGADSQGGGWRGLRIAN